MKLDPDEDLRQSLRRELEDRRLAEEAEALSASFPAFVKAAWRHVKPAEKYRHNWHIDGICEHLEAVSAGDIHRLQVWVPPGTMKSMTVSVFWHAWEWTRRPWLRYWGASYETRLAGRLSAMSRDLMTTKWYQERWGDKVTFTRDAEHYYGNSAGGTRMATAPEATGSGEHGHRILIDDPINAKDADATSKVTLNAVKEWYDGTVSSRGLDGVETPEGDEIDHARVIIMQRLHEEDLAAHVLELEDWVVLCIPERYEDNHTYAWRGRAGLRDENDLGSVIGVGDPREEGELLWPERRGEKASNTMQKQLRDRAAGQLQQRPAPREGQMLLRKWWRFYDPAILNDPARKPKCHLVVISADTPLRDKETNDMVAIQAWGVKGADRYLLDLRKGHLSKSQAKRAIIEMSRYVRKMYPRARHNILIENGGYGPDLVIELKRELTGVTSIPAGQDGDKVIRADSASDALESGNCWLPGIGGGADETLGPVRQASADVIDFIEELAVFDNGRYDDQVDAWSQAMIWIRNRPMRRGRTASPFKRRRGGDAVAA
jgi:predicted phage terminase large subunit-like protein